VGSARERDKEVHNVQRGVVVEMPDDIGSVLVDIHTLGASIDTMQQKVPSSLTPSEYNTNVAGTCICTSGAFRTKSAFYIPKNVRGCVIEKNSDGDLLIDFDGLIGREWVWKKHAILLEQVEARTVADKLALTRNQTTSSCILKRLPLPRMLPWRKARHLCYRWTRTTLYQEHASTRIPPFQIVSVLKGCGPKGRSLGKDSHPKMEERERGQRHRTVDSS
jgi:hypothetical protein